jgi:hypothetical protein
VTAADRTWWDDLFDPEPEQWGLRGDPYAWRALREAVRGLPAPQQSGELAQLLRRSFAQVVSSHPDEDGSEEVYVPAFAHGGMSSGMVCLPVWRDQLLPLLIARGAPRLASGSPAVGGTSASAAPPHA